jgi:hypothetical protein
MLAVAFLLAAALQPSGADLPFDCALEKFEAWTNLKQAWCCARHEPKCPASWPHPDQSSSHNDHSAAPAREQVQIVKKPDQGTQHGVRGEQPAHHSEVKTAATEPTAYYFTASTTRHHSEVKTAATELTAYYFTASTTRHTPAKEAPALQAEEGGLPAPQAPLHAVEDDALVGNPQSDDLLGGDPLWMFVVLVVVVLLAVALTMWLCVLVGRELDKGALSQASWPASRSDWNKEASGWQHLSSSSTAGRTALV